METIYVDEQLAEKHKNTVRDFLTHNASKSDPVTMKKMMSHSGLDDRTIRRIYEILLEEGLPVTSSNKGSWIAETAEELQSKIDNLRASIGGYENRISQLEVMQSKMIPALSV